MIEEAEKERDKVFANGKLTKLQHNVGLEAIEADFFRVVRSLSQDMEITVQVIDVLGDYVITDSYKLCRFLVAIGT